MPDYQPLEPSDQSAIVVTASRAPLPSGDVAASVSQIDDARLQRLGEPLVPGLLRLLPSVSVAAGGPAGSLSQVRIRGAEANHTLLFIDGIRANDPAAGNEPRFELLNADIVSRIEAVRGPQSALWGSEAIGGVIAVEGTTPTHGQALASLEVGSFGFRRLGGGLGTRIGDLGLSLAGGVQSAGGIDSFTAPGGDRDGYANAALRGRAVWSGRAPRCTPRRRGSRRR